MRISTKIKQFLSILFTAILLSQPVLAITETQLDIFAENNIMFYDPDENPCINGGTLSINTSDLSPETVKMIEDAKIQERAEANMSRYIYAQNETGLPWQILAALHWREGGMDSNASISNGDQLYDHINVDGIRVYADPNKDAKAAAEHFIANAKSVYGITEFNSLENIANGFLAYNRGFMYKNAGNTWDQSPYVMNYYDQDHWDMVWLHADSCNVKTGECYNSVEGTVSKQLGTLPIFVYLNGMSSTTVASGASVGGGDSAPIDGSNVTIIGDSITYGSLTAISSKMPSADVTAEVSRTFPTGLNIAEDPIDEDNNSYNFNGQPTNGKLSSELRQNVVFALGSNTTNVSPSDISRLLAATSGKNVYLLTNYASPSGSYSSNDYSSNNDLFRKTASENSNVYLIDWAAEVQKGDFLATDGLHPNSDGQNLFADLIYKTINGSTNTTICGGSGETWWSSGEWPWYDQGDEKWRDRKFGENGIDDPTGENTMGHHACGPTSFASIIAAYGIKNTEDLPIETTDYASKNGAYLAGGGTNWKVSEILADHYGLTYEYVFKYTSSKTATENEQYIAKINKYLNEGWLIHTVGNEPGTKGNEGKTPYSNNGHFIVIRGFSADGTKWLVGDPNWVNTGYKNTFEKEWNPEDIIYYMRQAVAIKK